MVDIDILRYREISIDWVFFRNLYLVIAICFLRKNSIIHNIERL